MRSVFLLFFVLTLNISFSQNTRPSVNPRTVYIAPGASSVTFTVTGTDQENDNLTFHIGQTPNRGSVVVSGNQITYTPSGTIVPDSFSYYVSDGSLNSFIKEINVSTSAIYNLPPNTIGGSSLSMSRKKAMVFETSTDTRFLNDIVLGLNSDDASSTTAAVYAELWTVNSSGIPEAYIENSRIAGAISISGNYQIFRFFYSSPFRLEARTKYAIVVYGIAGNGLKWTKRSPGNPQGLLSYTFRGFYLTEDGGSTWTQSSISQDNAISLNVIRLNQYQPEALPISVNVTEAASSQILLEGSDPENQPITYSIVRQPTNGTISLSENTATYTSFSGSYTTDYFTYKVTNSDGFSSDVARVDISIDQVNDPPSTSNISTSVVERRPFEIILKGSDPDNNTLTYSLVSGPANGQVVITGNKAVYTSNEGSYLTDSFTYKASDGSLSSNTSTVSIDIVDKIGADINGDLAYDYLGSSVSLSSNGSVLAIGARGFDGNGINLGQVGVYDWNGNSWVQRGSYIVGEASGDFSGSSVSLSSDGLVVAIGAPYNDGNGDYSGHVRVYEWNGASWIQRGRDIDGEAAGDQFGYSISLSSNGLVVAIGAYLNDGNGMDSGHVRVYDWNGTAWVQRGLDINGAAIYDFSGYSVSLSSDGLVLAIGAILNNDNGDNSGHVRIYEWNGTSWVQRGSSINGESSEDQFGSSVSLSTDGSVVAIGATLNNGSGVFSGHVRVFEWNGGTWIQRGTDIDGENADDLSGYSVSLSSDGSTLAIGARGNDANGSGSGHVRVFEWRDGSWVKLKADIDGKAAGDESGFSVSLSSDGSVVAIGAHRNDTNGDESGHVRIFALENTKPYARPQFATAIEQTASTFALDAGDLNGDSITYTLVSGPSNGTVSIATNGQATYTSNSDTATSDSFTYKVNDGVSDSETTTVSIEITPVNDPPVISDRTASTAEDTPLTISLTGSDIEGDELSFTATDPTNGTVLIEGSVLTYTPNPNFHGSDTFTYTANDGGSDSDPAAITLTITPVNDAPTAVDLTVSVVEMQAFQISLEGSDPEGDDLTYSIVSGPTKGSMSISGNIATYISNRGSITQDGFTYKVSDGSLESTIAQVSISIIDQIGSDIDGEVAGDRSGISIDFSTDGSVLAIGAPYNDGYGADSGHVRVYNWEGNYWSQRGNDINGELPGDQSGWSVSLSASGDVLAIGAPKNDGNGIDSGHVRVYKWNGDSWQQLGSDINGEAPEDGLGVNVSLSENGKVLAIYASRNDGGGTDSGQVRVYEWVIDTWIQRGSDIVGKARYDGSNSSISLSPDGSVIAIGNPYNDENETSAGIVRIYRWYEDDWVQQGNDILGEAQYDNLGASVSLSSNGTAIAIGVPNSDDNGSSAGHVRVYDWYESSWVQRGQDILGEKAGDYSGWSVSLSSDGLVLAIGSYGNDDNGNSSGHVRIFSWNGSTWLKKWATIIGESAEDLSGAEVVLNSEGTIVGVGSTYNDGNGDSSGHVRVYALENAMPYARPQKATALEQTATTIQLDAGDLNGDLITYAIVTQPSNGVVSIDSSGLATYTSSSDFATSDSFSYKVNDGQKDSFVAEVSVTITGVNDRPEVWDLTATTDEDTASAITLRGVDYDDDELTYAIKTNPTNGTISVEGAIATYLPNLNFNGTDTFTYVANDSTIDSEIATATVTVVARNDRPVVIDRLGATDEDTSIQITLTGTDPEDDELTFSVGEPNNGSVAIEGAVVTYTPNAHFNGTDSFTYSASDGLLISSDATITITINPVNDAPEVFDITVPTNEDTAVTFNLAGGDWDGDALTYMTSNPTNGTLTLEGDRATYLPNQDFNGIDSFTYSASDGVLSSTIATVTITIIPVNDAPIVSDIAVATNEDTPLEIIISGTDAEGSDLTFDVGDPSHGELVVEGATVTYTPDRHFNGTDTFTYTATDDGNLASVPGVVTITVNPVNDIPEANDLTVATNEDTPVIFNLPGGDWDGDVITYSVNDPVNGTIELEGETVTYTPDLNFNGVDRFTYKVNDGTADSELATVTIVVASVNDVPIVTDLSITTDEDFSVEVTLSVTDEDHSEFSYSLSDPENGSIVLQSGKVTYIPNADFSGSDSFTYVANDGVIDSNVATVSIEVNAVNDPPIILNQSITIVEDDVMDFLLDFSDVDSPRENLVLSITSEPSHGIAEIIDQSILRYTSTSDSATLDLIKVKVGDGFLDSEEAVITVNIAPWNDAPTVTDLDIVTNEDTAVEFMLLGNDPDGDELSYTVTEPSNGNIMIDGDVVTYTPFADFFGTDTITYVANDGTVDSVEGLISISVTPINDRPVISSQEITIVRGDTLDFLLEYRDVDSPRADLALLIITPPQDLTAEVIDNNLLRIETNSESPAEDSLTIIVTDGELDSLEATISIVVLPGNMWPTASAISATTNEDTATEITLLGTDLDGDELTYTVTEPTNGSVSLEGAVVTYTPAVNFNGADSFTYTANDGTVDSEPATVTITVTAVNDTPTVAAVTATTNEDTPTEITLLGTDVDGDELTYDTTDPENGTIVLEGAVVTYTPAANFNGTDSFTYTANDGTVDSEPAKVTITVTAVNDTPTVAAVTATTSEDSATEITLLGTDVDGDELTYTITEPTSGSVSLEGAVVTYTPAVNFNGADSFTYTANDAKVDSESATVTITVTAVNDAPTVSAVTATASEDTAIEITLLGTDVDGDELTYTVTEPTNGSVSLEGAVVTYTPDANFNGTDSFTYTANDATIDSEPATVTITVTAVNDAPTVAAVTATTSEDTATEITLLGTDVDGDELTYTVTEPTSGSVSLEGAVVTYTHAVNFNGTDSFTYTASDGTVDSEPATVTITVTAVADEPQFAMDNEGTISESASIGDVIASLEAIDGDGDELTFSLSNNTGEVFAISSGSLVVNKTLDYESATRHSVTITVSDGELNDSLDFTLLVEDVPNNSIQKTFSIDVYDVVNEDSTQKLDYTQWTSSTESFQTRNFIFEISGGEDAALFTLDPITGALDFIEAPDYENPSDANGDNVYIVTIKITNIHDGAPEIPVITSQTGVAVPEAQTAVMIIEAYNASSDADTDEDGIVDTEDNCPTTYNPGQEDTDGDGVGDVCDDSDMDTFFDAVDQCPNSAYGATVNAAGCEVFALPADTFSVTVSSATCPDASNGSITISSSNTDYSYRYAINDQAPVALSGNTQTIANLSAGVYTVCVTVDGVSDYERCYTIEITEPAPLVASSRVNISSRNMQLDLSGASEYQVTLNGKTFLTSEDKLSLNLAPGMNRIEVTTALDCQGVYFEEIFVSEAVKVYPNPTAGPLQLFVAGGDAEVELRVTTLSGNVVSAATLLVPANRIIETSLGNLPQGMYLITLNGTTVKTTHKVIKE